MKKLFISAIIISIPFVNAVAQSKTLENSPKGIESSPFHLVKEIKNRLNQDGIVVIFGAPCSGKSELMEIALPEEKHVFDLSEAFATYYANKFAEEKKTVLSIYSGAWSEKQEMLKIEQVNWLNQESQSIINELIASNNNIIIMDEFDFKGSSQPTEMEERSMKQIVNIAEEVRRSGKKIVFIIHAAAKNSSVFWEAMLDTFFYEPQDVVKTGFFTDEEEAYLLSQISGSEEEKAEFFAFAEGSPTAYLPVLRHKPDLTISKLKILAVTTSQLVVKGTKQINRPEVWAAMVAVAKGELSLDEIQDESIVEGMFESSFVGRKNGRLVMPNFARECLSNQT